MKYLFASDIHGSAYYCRKLLDAFEQEKADRLILLGDVLYHGPRNDLPRDYAPKQVIAMLNPLKERILCVRGNCEAEVDQMVLEFPCLADYAVLEAVSDSTAQSSKTMSIYLTHGHRYNIDTPLPMPQGSVMIYGHTHIPLDEVRNGCRFMNPGSVSIPKNGSKRGYFVLENGEFSFGELAE